MSLLERRKHDKPKQPAKTSVCQKGKSRKPGLKYTTDGYGKAIKRAIAKANKAGHQIPHWFPNQIRHKAATDIFLKYGGGTKGLELAQHFLGHASPETPRNYLGEIAKSIDYIAKTTEAALAMDEKPVLSPFN